ncbi:OsmC family protein [Streptomyces sp. NPDC048172]|uniref:OsmC family protein n=1 Tax=Streptomyces sp. NPDC048172 TaxID=3365505 RepID=UPI0037157D4D
MVEARALEEPWQVAFGTEGSEAVADTVKNGVGGTAGFRPHELLEAAFATCVTMTARMALAECGAAGEEGAGVRVRVWLGRDEEETRFHYAVELPPELERYREEVERRVERSPVRATLSRPLRFVPL